MSETVDAGTLRLRGILQAIEAAAAEAKPPAPLRQFAHLQEIRGRDVSIPGPRGPVAGRLYSPVGAPRCGLVWIHGGGFFTGDLDMMESHWVGLELAWRGISVLALDYRKAIGGVRHPVPSDDVLAGWLAAISGPALLDLPAEKVHIGGASAGANLATGVSLRLAAGAGPLPASLLLVYPVLHSVLPPASAEAAAAITLLAEDSRIRPDFARAINLNYVGDEAGLADPIAFPANADVSVLPRTYVLNAEADELRASGEAFAAQMRSSGVEVRVEFEPASRHGFLNEPDLAEAQASLERIAGWLLGGQS